MPEETKPEYVPIDESGECCPICGSYDLTETPAGPGCVQCGAMIEDYDTE
jgi:hypothetical protein